MISSGIKIFMNYSNFVTGNENNENEISARKINNKEYVPFCAEIS